MSTLSLSAAIYNNENLNRFFSLSSTKKIWNIMITEVTGITINYLAPGKETHIKGKSITYMKQEITDQLQSANEALQ